MRKAKISVYDIVVIGMMVAALESAKLALSFLPNIELVTLLIILFTLTVGKKIYYAVFAFVVLEGLLYGFGIWWVMYLYMWPLLAWVTWLLRRKKTSGRLPFYPGRLVWASARCARSRICSWAGSTPRLHGGFRAFRSTSSMGSAILS